MKLLQATSIFLLATLLVGHQDTCNAYYFFEGQPQVPQPSPASSVQLESRRSSAPLDERTSIVLEGDEGNFLLLSDNELVQNAEILRHLTGASKEEVEDIVDSNPVIQDALLSKIRNIIEIRGQGDGNGHEHHNNQANPSQQSQQLPSPLHDRPIIIHSHGNQRPAPTDEDYDEEADEQIVAPFDAKKLAMLKLKLKAKAAKLVKIGAGVKKKLLLLKKKKKKKEKLLLPAAKIAAPVPSPQLAGAQSQPVVKQEAPSGLSGILQRLRFDVSTAHHSGSNRDQQPQPPQAVSQHPI